MRAAAKKAARRRTPPRHRSTASRLELTILMPCLDEAETVGACVDKAKGFLRRRRVRGEVLVADNGSADGSQRIARAHGARVVEVARKGYGAALLGGIEAARGRYIVMGDADGSYDFSALERFLDELRAGNDLVMGNRFAGGIAPGAMPPLHRYLGNPLLSFLGRLLFGMPIRDILCGLRGFRISAVRALGLRTSGMEFAIESVVRSALAGLRIAQVPTTLAPDGRSRPPHLRTWRDGWRVLKFMLIFSPRWLFVAPGAALVVLGTLLAAALFYGPLRFTGNVVLDLNTFIVACLLIVVGFQILTFGALSHRYATVAGFSPPQRAAWRRPTTERLLAIAFVLAAVGLGMIGYAVETWASRNFGSLTDPFIPRTVVAGMALTLIGLQTFFAAFLFGILEIPLQAREPPGDIGGQ